MAAPVNKAKFTQDINAPIKAIYGGGLMFSKDNLSNVISVDIVDNGNPFEVTGTVSGTVIRSDGTTIPVNTGAISGNTVSLTLTEACFDVPGQIVVNIIVTNGDVKCCVLRAVYTVVPTETSAVVDPGDILPSIADLIKDIDAAVASIPADYSGLLASIAGTFSPSTAYAAGSYVWYDGTLYRFTAAHAAGSWTGSDATEVTFGGEITDIKSVLDVNSDITYEYTDGSFITHDGNIAQAGPYRYSDPIALSRGSTIILTCTTSGNAAAIAECDESMSIITPRVIGISGSEQKYTFTATSDTFVVISYNRNFYNEASIYGKQSNKMLDERIDSLKNIIAPVIENMVADTNLFVNDFRIAGNTLYKITSSIAAGGTLTVGTNCVATTLAEQISAILNA